MPAMPTQAGRLGRNDATNAVRPGRGVAPHGFVLIRLPDTVLAWDASAAELLQIPPGLSAPLDWDQFSAGSPQLDELGWHPRTIARGGSSGPLAWPSEHPSEDMHIELISLSSGGTSDEVLLRLRSPGFANEQRMRLEHLNRLGDLGRLSASMAHEIKNSLVAIKTFVAAMREQHPELELGGVAAGEVERIQAITMRMLDYAAPAPAERQVLDLHAVVDQALAIVRHEALSRGVRVRPEFFADGHRVAGHSRQLEQAFINLFLNALAAMEGGGELRVISDNVTLPSPPRRSGATPVPTDWVRLCVADSGCGIPPEQLGRVFDPFFTTREDGTGLGLAITRDIVESHAGWINVESTVGEGTTFRLFLPVAGASSASGAASQECA